MATINKHQVIEVEGCLEIDSNEESGGTGKDNQMCKDIKMAKIMQKEHTYSMIKIEFNKLEDPSLLNAAAVANYVGVQF